MNNISKLEPKCVFGFFDEITRIPRVSQNEKNISDYLVKFASDRGFIAYQDKLLNVTILKPATEGMEDKNTVILQAHMDMVGAKKEGKDFDFGANPIEAYEEDGFVKAKGTTLGADDGIGMAMILALLDSKDASHPMLEAVFTVNEEVGLVGAAGYDYKKLKGKRLINIDSEEENHIVTGCAGGCTTSITSKCRKEKSEGIVYEVIISGLIGGHSGLNINEGRANANVIMGRLFARVRDVCETALSEYEGGTLDNAICNLAKAELVVKKKNSDDFEKAVEEFYKDIRLEYCKTDPDLKIKVKNHGKSKKETVSAGDFDRITGILASLTNGIYKYSQNIDGCVIASSNIGIVRVKPKQFSINTFVRGNRDYLTRELVDKNRRIAEAFGAQMTDSGLMPAWEGVPDGDFAKQAENIYRKLFPGRDIGVTTIHAGVECAYFCNNIKGLEAISLGPNLTGAHTVCESLDVESTQRMWEFLKELVKC